MREQWSIVVLVVCNRPGLSHIAARTVAQSSLPSHQPGMNIHRRILLAHLLFIYLPVQSPPTSKSVGLTPNQAKMASTGVPASSCRHPLTASFEFSRHTVMSQIHPCPRHFQVPKSKSKVTVGPHVVCDKNRKKGSAI